MLKRLEFTFRGKRVPGYQVASLAVISFLGLFGLSRKLSVAKCNIERNL